MHTSIIQKLSLFSLMAFMLTACVSSGIVSEARITSKADEQWTRILNTVPISKDLETTTHVAKITVELLAAAGEDPVDWQIVVLEGPDVFNAFALPNKRIGVFTGLIYNVENDDQLAAVIGHEIAHVQLHHVEARVNRAAAPNILIGVAKLPGKLSGVPVLESTGKAVGGVVNAGTVLPYNRNQEIEADKVGISYSYKAGYDPKEAAELWRHVNEQASSAKRMTPEFLSTHPSTEHRIRELEKATKALLEHD